MGTIKLPKEINVLTRLLLKPDCLILDMKKMPVLTMKVLCTMNCKIICKLQGELFELQACKELQQVDVPGLLAFHNLYMGNIPFCTLNSNFYTS